MIYLSMTLSKIFRYTLLAIFNALIVYAVPLALTFESWFFLSLILVIGILVNVVYFTDRFQPMKWILPGMIFMLSFVVFPAVYNTYVSFTNWSTGHILTKTQAIGVLEDRVFTPDDQKGLEFEMYILQDFDLNFYLNLIIFFNSTKFKLILISRYPGSGSDLNLDGSTISTV